ncbi:MAG: SpoIIE family protein phosphatase [Bacteroidia bacterium]|nr:SpoIIE family protein phosphatase [Bacteroidia bacterium]
MKILKFILFLAVTLFVIHPISLFSQNSYDDFKCYTIDQGLSQSCIYTTLQDSKGYMWFGTQSGLNKYDGFKFEIIQYDLTDTNSLSNNWIYSLAEDRYGNIWVATRTGLNMLDPTTNRVKRYLRNQYNPNTLPDDKTYGLLIDKEGIIWVRTPNAISKIDPKTGKIINFDFPVDYFSFFERDYGWPMYEDKEGNIWFGSYDGLHIFNKKDEHFSVFKNEDKNFKSLCDNRVTAIIEDKFRNLWIGTHDGLNKFNKKTRSFKRYYHDPNNTRSLIDNEINSLFIDHEGLLWVGTVNGLSKYNPNAETFTNFQNDPNRQNSLSYNSVTSIYEDRSYNLWIGTDGGGVNKIDLKPKKFITYNIYNGLCGNVIASIFEESKKSLWVGTWGTGLNQFNRETGEMKFFSEKSAKDKKILNDYVHVIFKDSRGKIWLGTRKGINIYYPETKKFITLQDYFKGDIKITARVNTIIEAKDKTIWIGTENGVYILDFNNNEAKGFFHNSQDSNSISSNHIYAVMEDNDGDIWVTTTNGLNKLSFLPLKVQRFMHNPQNRNSISSNYVYAIIQDKEGLIWLATSCGLNMYNKKTNTFIYYTSKQGLPGDDLYGIIEDKSGDIWITCTRGISRFNKKNKSFKNYDKDDGLQGLEFNLGANLRSPVDGEIFLGGISGFNAFYPENIKSNVFVPQVMINKIIKKSNTGETSILFEEGKDVILTYQDYLLTIEFASLDFTNPEKNIYAYKIEGMSNQSDEWLNIGNRNFVSFTNMPPGDYTITIKGSNNDHIWNNKGVSLHVIMKTPYWKTIWAYILYILIISSIVWYYITTRTKKLKSANQILREKQYAALEIAKQKEDLSRKNKAITDSINYAKRIQEAMMPSEYLFNKLLTDAFILYKPKDIVSGDFYWIAEKKNKIFVAAVDCTGHGVPGAFMSIIGYDLLKTITKEREIENPAEILNQMNEGVSDTFSKNIVDWDVRDGMDISLCVIDKNNKTIEYAGAINPLFVVRNNRVVEIRGNRFSVGSNDLDEKFTFEHHIMPLRDNDMVYLFSDGYADQFGGPLGKKYKYKRFRHFLQTISAYPLKEQKKYLEDNINKWRGDMEQVDDILVIGIRVTKSLN